MYPLYSFPFLTLLSAAGREGGLWADVVGTVKEEPALKDSLEIAGGKNGPGSI